MHRWEKARDQLRALRLPIELSPEGDFTSEELLGTVREAAATVERFLRQLEIGAAGSARYSELVTGLSGAGLANEHVWALHALRKSGNEAKHDVAAVVTHSGVVATLSRAEAALEAIADVRGVGGALDDVPVTYARRFAILPSYYFHGPRFPEADYEIVLFNKKGDILVVDQYQTASRDEEKALATLRELGRLDQEPDDPEFAAYRKDFASSWEFWGIWTYTGQLRDIAAAFARLQQSDAFDFLQRKGNESAVLSALAMTLVDVGLAATLEDVRLHLESVYAITLRPDGPPIERVGKLLVAAQRRDPPPLRGPRLLSRAVFQALAADALVEPALPRIGIRADGTVIVDLGEPWTPMP